MTSERKRISICFRTKDRKNDVALLKEVISIDPFLDETRWNQVAENLNFYLHPEKPATARTVRERTELILEKFKKDEALSKKKSGVNEPHTELMTLLLEATELKCEAVTVKAQAAAKAQSQTPERAEAREKRDKEVKALEDIKQGKRIRDRAMKRMLDEESSDDDPQQASGSDSGSEGEEQIINKKCKTKKRNRARADPLMHILQKKWELEERREERLQQELEQRRRESEIHLQMLQMLVKEKQTEH